MASAELAQFPLTAQALVARLPVLAQLAGFQRALNEQFDNCRHVDRYRPGIALQRLSSGVELLCQLQEELLHPALSASRPQAWPELGQAMESVTALRDLAVMGSRAADSRQLALLALLEGLVQLQFVGLDELLAQADATAMHWPMLESAVEDALQQWQAGQRDTDNARVLN